MIKTWQLRLCISGFTLRNGCEGAGLGLAVWMLWWHWLCLHPPAPCILRKGISHPGAEPGCHRRCFPRRAAWHCPSTAQPSSGTPGFWWELAVSKPAGLACAQQVVGVQGLIRGGKETRQGRSEHLNLATKIQTVPLKHRL